MKERKLNIGWAQCSITPHQPLLMEGQMYPRVSRYVHDPITATAMVLENGETQAIFVSMDMTEVPNHAMAPLKAALAEHGEIKFENISFNVTHTHNATSFYNDFMRSENEQVYDPKILPPLEIPENTLYLDAGVAFFVEKLKKLILAAWERRAPGGISYAHDYAAIGFCRRPHSYKGECLRNRPSLYQRSRRYPQSRRYQARSRADPNSKP